MIKLGRYTEKERNNIVRFYLDHSFSVERVADEYNINKSTLIKWIKDYRTAFPDEPRCASRKVGRRVVPLSEKQKKLVRAYLSSGQKPTAFARENNVTVSKLMSLTERYEKEKQN